MLIGELARRTGVSPRSLRHYEDVGVLTARRTAAGYREYDERDVVVVAQIRAMLDAGLNAALVKRYLDCARTGEHGTSLEMCPDLRASLDALAERFDRETRALADRRARLSELADTSAVQAVQAAHGPE